MQTEPLEEQIIDDLGEQRRENDIVQDICEQTGLPWKSAEELVSEVKADHRDLINQRRRMPVVILGVTFVGAGILLAVLMIVGALNGVNIQLRQIPIPYSGNFVFALFGIFLTTGGYLGLKKAW
jgi:hypothetical protein